MPTQRSSRSYPKRGEIYIADLNPGFGREIHKKRPVLIISNDILNQTSFTTVITPFSSIVPQFISPDMVEAPQLKGLDKESVILIDKIRSIDKERLMEKVGRLSQAKLSEVEESLKLVLGMVELD